jgi:hypothetical protein
MFIALQRRSRAVAVAARLSDRLPKPRIYQICSPTFLQHSSTFLQHFLQHFFHSLKVSFHEKDLLSEDVLSVFVGSPPPRSALEQEPEPGNAGRGLNRPPVV